MLTFIASVIKGEGRGKGLGYPTLNLKLEEVPIGLADGVHACTASINNATYPAVLFKGNRPVFGDPPACEVHVLDIEITDPPTKLKVHVLEHVRDVEDYESPEALKVQIAKDIGNVRGILDIL